MGANAQHRILLVIDGAGWHTGAEVVVPEGLHLVIQPPYSPQLQPSERLWPLLRESLANRDSKDLAEHRSVTGERCREISAQPDVVRGRTLMHGWPEDHRPPITTNDAERAAS